MVHKNNLGTDTGPKETKGNKISSRHLCLSWLWGCFLRKQNKPTSPSQPPPQNHLASGECLLLPPFFGCFKHIPVHPHNKEVSKQTAHPIEKWDWRGAALTLPIKSSELGAAMFSCRDTPNVTDAAKCHVDTDI